MYQNFRTIGALVNSMIGSSILIFPILFVQNGILISIIIVTIAGISAAYSNLITIRHMSQDENDFKDTICRHNKRTDLFPWFSLFVFLSCQLFLYSYFNLVVKQWRGLFFRQLEYHQYIPLFSLISIFILSISIKKLHLGITLMAIGIISVVISIWFMGWMFYSRPQPQMKPFPLVKGESLTDLITLAIGAMSIQNVFVEILRQHPFQKDRTKLIWISYGIGTLVYLFIGIFGGYGILQRSSVYQNAKTIMEYFYTNQWQPFVLEIIYLIHLYSVWPQWSHINGVRLAHILAVEPTDMKINIYLFVSTFIGFLLYILKVNLTTFINLNGGVCLFFALFAIPMYHHIICNYFKDESSQSNIVSYENPEWQIQDQKCNMERRNQTIHEKIVDIIILSIMALFGTAALLITLKETFLKIKLH